MEKRSSVFFYLDHFHCFSIDCIGILKLRNADVEAMESTTRSKKKSQRARMVFRVSVPRSDGSSFTLQTMSDTIQCCEYQDLCFYIFVSFKEMRLCPQIQRENLRCFKVSILERKFSAVNFASVCFRRGIFTVNVAYLSEHLFLGNVVVPFRSLTTGSFY